MSDAGGRDSGCRWPSGCVHIARGIPSVVAVTLWSAARPQPRPEALSQPAFPVSSLLWLSPSAALASPGLVTVLTLKDVPLFRYLVCLREDDHVFFTSVLFVGVAPSGVSSASHGRVLGAGGTWPRGWKLSLCGSVLLARVVRGLSTSDHGNIGPWFSLPAVCPPESGPLDWLRRVPSSSVFWKRLRGLVLAL